MTVQDWTAQRELERDIVFAAKCVFMSGLSHLRVDTRLMEEKSMITDCNNNCIYTPADLLAAALLHHIMLLLHEQGIRQIG